MKKPPPTNAATEFADLIFEQVRNRPDRAVVAAALAGEMAAIIAKDRSFPESVEVMRAIANHLEKRNARPV
jgi:uncharacterized protein YozE (UPF0346 family)